MALADHRAAIARTRLVQPIALLIALALFAGAVFDIWIRLR